MDDTRLRETPSQDMSLWMRSGVAVTRWMICFIRPPIDLEALAGPFWMR
jgi:hypothetical protein